MSSVLEFFQRVPIHAVSSAALTETLADPAAPPVTILFLWGHDCPNCDVAKRALLVDPARAIWPDVRWLHCNVYDDPELGTRFSLHGVPTFIVFRGTKSAGRVTGWPGLSSFTAAIERQRALIA